MKKKKMIDGHTTFEPLLDCCISHNISIENPSNFFSILKNYSLFNLKLRYISLNVIRMSTFFYHSKENIETEKNRKLRKSLKLFIMMLPYKVS